jgi:hypothetical protein
VPRFDICSFRFNFFASENDLANDNRPAPTSVRAFFLMDGIFSNVLPISKKLQILVSIILIFFISGFVQAADYKQRLEELFIWKVSEELKLDPAEEKKFGDTVRDINKSKAALQKDLDDQIDRIKTAGEKDLKKELSNYKSKLKKYNDLAVSEVDRIKRAIGDQKTARYLVLKSELSTKLKSMLSEKKTE